MFQKHQYSKHLPGLAAAIQSVNNLFNYSGFFLLSSNQPSEGILQKQIP
jgi:hypothetical protein